MLQFQKNLRRLLLQETAIKKPLRGRMFSVQESLPHLPVPPLQHTLDKFLRSVKPILSDDDYKRAQKVSSFIKFTFIRLFLSNSRWYKLLSSQYPVKKCLNFNICVPAVWLEDFVNFKHLMKK